MHPLLHLIATRPQLLADHAGAYADLAMAELGQASAGWQRQAVLTAATACSLLVATILAGVALMLWAVTPAANLHAPWALLAAPLLPAVVALACHLARQPTGTGAAFGVLRRQVQDDMRMLRSVGNP